MKKVLLALMVAMSALLMFSACSKEGKFNYPMEDVYGTWKGIAVKTEKYGWVDITGSAYKDLQFSISFYKDGKYYGKGYFGTGWGTYEAKGNTIYTYVDGEEYYRYDVIDFSRTKAELTMSKGNSAIDIRVEKE